MISVFVSRWCPSLVVSVCWLLLLVPRQLDAANWPQWRGPEFNGSSPERGLPVEWSKTNSVAWAAPLPGWSGATPIVWENQVFATSPDEQKRLLLLCYDRETGKSNWAKQVGGGDRSVGRNNMASPSPVTDGKRVYALYATGDLAAFDMDGRAVWSRNLANEYGKFANMWIYGSSPMLYEGRLYVQVLQRSPVPGDYQHAVDGRGERDSYLLCQDPETGTNIWRHLRVTDAREEAMEAYSTPIPHRVGGGLEILVVGANYVTGHDSEDGVELWRCAGLNRGAEAYWRIVPSPVVANDIIVACGPKRDPVLGIRAGGKGDISSSHIAWEFKEFPTDCVTPLYYEGKLFVLDGDRQRVTALEPRTGKKLWQGSLPVREIFRASPTGADGRIYCISESGTAVVLGAGDEFKVLAAIPMGESPVRSSIAVAHSHLFIRTGKTLYCIGRGHTQTSKGE